MEDIEQKVIEIVSEQMGVDKSEITRETHFINDLNADSLDTVELVMEFEDEFELSIPDEEAEKIQTVGQANFLLVTSACTAIAASTSTTKADTHRPGYRTGTAWIRSGPRAVGVSCCDTGGSLSSRRG